MNVFNDSPQIDYVDYFTNQLPKNLAAMAQLRDELARRQGAMTAVDDANKLRTEAAAILADAKAQYADLTAKAKTEYDSAMTKIKAAQSKLDNTLKELNAREKAFDDSYTVRVADITRRETNTAILEKELADKQTRLNVLDAKLAADRAALDARIKAFQDKVASLAV
jgi:chromosome segregation ATPase